MDKRICAGVGNYIKCEVLYRSRVSPYRELGDFVFDFEAYVQKTEPLGNPVVREETPDKRTTYWVPSIQA